MYGNGVYSRQVVTQPQEVELPMAPMRQRPTTTSSSCSIDWRTFALILSLMAAASLSIGVADVVYTYQTYTVGKSCGTNTNPPYCNPSVLLFTWIASGIWASIPVFIYGLWLLCNKGSMSTCVELLLFLCAFVFTPAMIVLSAIEVWKGVNVFYWSAAGLPSDDIVKAALPIAVAALGFLEWLMCAIAFYHICCSGSRSSKAYGGGGAVVTTTSTNMYQPQPVMVSNTATYERPACAPCAQVQAPRPACAPCAQAQAPRPACAPCQSSLTLYNGGGAMGYGGQTGGGGGCSSCPRSAPNNAYNFYRS